MMVMHSLLVVVNPKKKTDEASLSSSSKRDIHESEVDKMFYELHSKHAVTILALSTGSRVA